VKNNSMIKVLICDDQLVVCEGLRAILSTAPGIEVVGIASNGVEALKRIEDFHPDLILMDLKMPIMNGIQATRLIHERYPAARVLVLTNYDFDEWVLDALRWGASGYVLKDSPRAALVAAIQSAAAGRPQNNPAGKAGKPARPAVHLHVHRRSGGTA
jgi:NarL family two-component system response regulator LiaR